GCHQPIEEVCTECLIIWGQPRHDLVEVRADDLGRAAEILQRRKSQDAGPEPALFVPQPNKHELKVGSLDSLVGFPLAVRCSCGLCKRDAARDRLLDQRIDERRFYLDWIFLSFPLLIVYVEWL